MSWHDWMPEGPLAAIETIKPGPNFFKSINSLFSLSILPFDCCFLKTASLCSAEFEDPPRPKEKGIRHE
jgi:hypothetical protein